MEDINTITIICAAITLVSGLSLVAIRKQVTDYLTTRPLLQVTCGIAGFLTVILGLIAVLT